MPSSGIQLVLLLSVESHISYRDDFGGYEVILIEMWWSVLLSRLSVKSMNYMGVLALYDQLYVDIKPWLLEFRFACGITLCVFNLPREILLLPCSVFSLSLAEYLIWEAAHAGLASRADPPDPDAHCNAWREVIQSQWLLGLITLRNQSGLI